MTINWHPLDTTAPDEHVPILVYRTVLMGGYYPGIYRAVYHGEKCCDAPMLVVIDDMETNRNNYRRLKEFSHWILEKDMIPK